MPFPARRPRRLRRTETLRRSLGETRLHVEQFIAPLFVIPGRRQRKPIASLPGQSQLSVDEVVAEVEELRGLGVQQIILFGVPEDARKDEIGSEAWNDEGLVQEALRAVRAAHPDVTLIADACFDEYTSHGHCGVVHASGDVDNDATLANLGRVAVSQAKAGADLIAPSGMMDGFVRETRRALDAANFSDIAILAYSAKYASCFYGPFREAAGTSSDFGHRRGYQMNPQNAREALVEVELDVEEGADILMVKPALAYLDIIAKVRAAVNLPVAAYNVSGEYAMLRAAAERGWLDLDRAILETLTSISRAGADWILTYESKRAAQLLRRG